MKKSLFIMALGAIALTSCSQDEIIEVKKDAITFATVAETTSRATEATTTSTIEDFKVWGVLTQDGGTNYYTYIDGLLCERPDDTDPWINHNSGYYWPEGVMDFYAVSPSTVAFSLGTPSEYAANTASITTFTISPSDPTNATDLLYAVSTSQQKQTTAVDLNFQHALAQVAFKVKVADTFKQSVRLDVKNISVLNLNNTGSYALPKGGSTHDDKKGTWTSSGIEDFSVDVTNGELNYVFNTLTNTGTEVELTDIDVMYVIPQTLAASTSGVWTSGACFVLDVDIYAQTKEGTEILLVNTPTYVPYDIEWAEGNKYTYTFTYSDGGNGGLKEDGTEQLLKIKFDVDVDAFSPQTEVVVPVQAAAVAP